MSRQSEMFFEYIALGGVRCPTCTYQLDGLREPRCPECGEELVLCVRGDSVRAKEWLVGLVAWAMAVGIYDLLIGVATVVGNPPPLRFWAFPLGAIVSTPCFIIWLLLRRRFPRLSSRQRRVAATGSVAIVLGLIVLTACQLR